MARPHIEFIQCQVIPFTSGLYGGARDEIETRTLSQDDTDGSASTILKYPPGWSRTTPHVLYADEEFFVLEGSMKINGVTYGKHAYAHLPKGYVRNSHSTEKGAVVLTFFSAEPGAEDRGNSTDDYDDRKLIELIDTQKMSPHVGKRDHMKSGDWDPSGTTHKKLYEDPDTGELTWLIGMAPGWWTAKAEIHPVVEEEFAILGDICFPIGVMRDGGYFWRPPGIEHGPFATWGGSLHLCRCKGGPFATDWQETDGPDWHPEYRPILPPEYQAYVEAAENQDREPGY